jgi:hypothetical protein
VLAAIAKSSAKEEVSGFSSEYGTGVSLSGSILILMQGESGALQLFGVSIYTFLKSANKKDPVVKRGRNVIRGN